MPSAPPAPGEAQMADSISDSAGNVAAQAAAPELPQTPTEFRPERTEAFDALIEDIRKRLNSILPFLVPRLEDSIRRRLGLAPMGAGAGALTVLVGSGIRLAFVLLATALFGQWAGMPWGRWISIFVLLSILDNLVLRITPPPDVSWGPLLTRMMENQTPLLSKIVRESDVRELARFTRRWIRLPGAAPVGLAATAIMLLVCWWAAPSAMGELPVGSIVALALLLYEFGAAIIYGGVLINWVFMAREARYDHHLFWPSPADTPEVQRAMWKTAVQGSVTGMWVTVVLVMTVVLVGWDSQLVLPLAVGFVVIGYLAAIGAALGGRASVRRIVERSRQQRLQGLQRRIDAFGPRYTNLSTQQSEELRDLLFLHDRIRDAPAAPTTTHTLVRTAAGLLIPTIAFVITVFGEVSAERILDAILP